MKAPALAAALLVLSGCAAQMNQTSASTPTSIAIPAAPVLATDRDTDGRPLPFGRRPYQPAETPLGSGRYKAVMATDASLPAHVLYHPADLAAAPRLPVIAWGNGACINAGNRFRDFLTEIASHGYLVAANGVMADRALEVGPQENPPVRALGSPPPPPPPPAPGAVPNAQRAPGTTNAQQLVETIDWAVRANADPQSPFYQRIDTDRVGVMGQSCGGVQALEVAGDPRIDTMVIWSSGAGMIPNRPNADTLLPTIHTPVAFIYGDPRFEVAHESATMNVRRLAAEGRPVFGAWQDNLTHLGTFGQQDGGFSGRLAVAWLDWQLKGDAQAGRMFAGRDCILCTAPGWHVTSNGLD